MSPSKKNIHEQSKTKLDRYSMIIMDQAKLNQKKAPIIAGYIGGHIAAVGRSSEIEPDQ